MTDQQDFRPKWKNQNPEASKPGTDVGVSEFKELKKGETEPAAGAGNQAEAATGLLHKIRRPSRAQVVVPNVRDEMAVRIEKIMENGIGDAYSRLSPVAKQEFKLKGEQTAVQIRELLKSTHVKVKKIFQLILEWLKLLPGINHFFLEQEAKIKTDRILALKDHLINR